MSREKKILLVTGASSDMGIELIRRNHENYEKIIAHYNSNNTEIIKLKNEIGSKIIPMQANFLDEGSTNEFVKVIIEQDMHPDHFVHLPASPLNNIKFAKTTWDTFKLEMNTSFRSAVLLSQGFLPKMATQKYGKIIFMLSFNIVNQPPIKYAVPYTSAKYAILGLLKGLSAEYADKYVTINGVSPSMTQTKFLDKVPQLIVDKNAMDSPLKRNLYVKEVIPACEFLLSDGSDCVTGQNIAVTGGN